MSDRPVSPRKRQHADPHPSDNDAVATGDALPPGPEIDGLVAQSAATRSGDDVRRRGWFWHWNSIVTQYAPLIGLKGVGLLNSYTVWTDRRDESPHRGYAFPSQQSEADFYGEDRAELITINKLLVALDLIEIRKEMVLRVDERGRRWKVPHNFYRVKDHDDGSSLTSRDVLRVAELADKDRTVYRYVRRMFSPRFSPIDRDNVWVGILEEVRQTDVWVRLAARTLRDEQRASERTKAGHAARKGAFGVPKSVDSATPTTTVNDSTAAATNKGGSTIVASTNNGLEVDVAPANTGSTPDSTTIVDPDNKGRQTAVDQTNRTYNEFPLTTTTTTDDAQEPRAPSTGQTFDRPSGRSQGPVTGRDLTVTGPVGTGPGNRSAPSDAPMQDAAIRAFEDANGRTSTPAERQLLRGLAERFEPAAADQRVTGRETGWGWVTAAVYEAVESGSAYVAPRRLREILSRWEREGMVDRRAASGDPPLANIEPKARGASRRRRSGEGQRSSDQPDEQDARVILGDAPDIELPHGFGSRKTWAFAVAQLGTALEPARLADLMRGTAIVGYHEGEVTIAVRDAEQAERIAGAYGRLIARKLGEAMRRPIRIALVMTGETDGIIDDPGSGDGTADVVRGEHVAASKLGDLEREPEIPSFIVAECGLPSAQVWAAVIDEVATSGDVSIANVDAWLRSTRLIARGPDGRLIVGVAHGLAQRRVASRFTSPLQAAATAILGREVPLEIVVAREWLLTHLEQSPGSTTGEAGVA